MKWESKLALSFTAIMMWIGATGYFSAFRILGDPEGVESALAGVFVVGPMFQYYIFGVLCLSIRVRLISRKPLGC